MTGSKGSPTPPSNPHSQKNNTTTTIQNDNKEN